jgi:hypothetical protein
VQIIKGELDKKATVLQFEKNETEVKLTSSIDGIGGFSEILMPLLASCSLSFSLGGAQGLSLALSNSSEFTVSSCEHSVLDGILIEADRFLAGSSAGSSGASSSSLWIVLLRQFKEYKKISVVAE